MLCFRATLETGSKGAATLGADPTPAVEGTAALKCKGVNHDRAKAADPRIRRDNECPIRVHRRRSGADRRKAHQSRRQDRGPPCARWRGGGRAHRLLRQNDPSRTHRRTHACGTLSQPLARTRLAHALDGLSHEDLPPFDDARLLVRRRMARGARAPQGGHHLRRVGDLQRRPLRRSPHRRRARPRARGSGDARESRDRSFESSVSARLCSGRKRSARRKTLYL